MLLTYALHLWRISNCIARRVQQLGGLQAFGRASAYGLGLPLWLYVRAGRCVGACGRGHRLAALGQRATGAVRGSWLCRLRGHGATLLNANALRGCGIGLCGELGCTLGA